MEIGQGLLVVGQPLGDVGRVERGRGRKRAIRLRPGEAVAGDFVIAQAYAEIGDVEVGQGVERAVGERLPEQRGCFLPSPEVCQDADLRRGRGIVLPTGLGGGECRVEGGEGLVVLAEREQGEAAPRGDRIGLFGGVGRQRIEHALRLPGFGRRVGEREPHGAGRGIGYAELQRSLEIGG